MSYLDPELSKILVNYQKGHFRFGAKAKVQQKSSDSKRREIPQTASKRPMLETPDEPAIQQIFEPNIPSIDPLADTFITQFGFEVVGGIKGENREEESSFAAPSSSTASYANSFNGNPTNPHDDDDDDDDVPQSLPKPTKIKRKRKTPQRPIPTPVSSSDADDDDDEESHRGALLAIQDAADRIASNYSGICLQHTPTTAAKAAQAAKSAQKAALDAAAAVSYEDAIAAAHNASKLASELNKELAAAMALAAALAPCAMRATEAANEAAGYAADFFQL